ncbi:MAG: hypothetical protein ACOCVA_03710 [Prolixibacteraceae bacterium]
MVNESILYLRKFPYIRTYIYLCYYRLLSFWDKTDNQDTLVIATHGIIKKTDKISKAEIEKAKSIMKRYFEEKQKRALKAKVNFNVELIDGEFKIA